MEHALFVSTDNTIRVDKPSTVIFSLLKKLFVLHKKHTKNAFKYNTQAIEKTFFVSTEKYLFQVLLRYIYSTQWYCK